TNPCSVPLAPGTGSTNLTRYYYNADVKQCVKFTYTGAGGNQNNFLTKIECQVMCPVKSKMCVTGEPAIDSFGQEMHCDPLRDYDNGCPKNYWCHPGDNVHEALCCPDGTVELQSACELPLVSGNGSETISRWFFDQKSKRCLQFLYSGIGGNGNNFISKKQCEKSCTGNAL
uniref:BPTI/Kunitz inhibitor domain-containing protein n=1 Tax=Romanomermis culicivorax TaxID=13658 RepID=A0A915KC91_ROMCU